MYLSLNLEYFGECNDVINFYADVFKNASKQVQTYKEMPMRDAFGITGQSLDMVWQSTLSVNFGEYGMRFEMSDSLLVAMQSRVDHTKMLYNPLLCITHKDENDVRALFNNLYAGRHTFEEIQTGNHNDKYGIRWMYQQNNNDGIYYCFEFDGFCCDVIDYYENAFNVKAENIIRYADSPYAHEIGDSGADKIYSAEIKFGHGSQCYALKLSDDMNSARTGSYGYNPNALLFYKNMYNPILMLKDHNAAYLTESFKRLSVGAKLNKAIAPGSDGHIHGSLIDRFGICWDFNSIKGAA